MAVCVRAAGTFCTISISTVIASNRISSGVYKITHFCLKTISIVTCDTPGSVNNRAGITVFISTVIVVVLVAAVTPDSPVNIAARAPWDHKSTVPALSPRGHDKPVLTVCTIWNSVAVNRAF